MLHILSSCVVIFPKVPTQRKFTKGNVVFNLVDCLKLPGKRRVSPNPEYKNIQKHITSSVIICDSVTSDSFSSAVVFFSWWFHHQWSKFDYQNDLYLFVLLTRVFIFPSPSLYISPLYIQVKCHWAQHQQRLRFFLFLCLLLSIMSSWSEVIS